MSDEEGSEASEPEMQSLDDVQEAFYEKMKHRPHSVKQLLAYCQQNKTGHKWRDINQWWPNRPDPEEKPVEKAVNADEYNKDPNAPEKESDDDEDEESENDKDDEKEAPNEQEPGNNEEEEEEPKKYAFLRHILCYLYILSTI